MVLVIETKLSKELSSELVQDEHITHKTMLHEALDTFEVNKSENCQELSDLIVVYGPDTTVGELLAMARPEVPEKFGMKDFLNWLAFWR